MDVEVITKFKPRDTLENNWPGLFKNVNAIKDTEGW